MSPRSDNSSRRATNVLAGTVLAGTVLAGTVLAVVLIALGTVSGLHRSGVLLADERDGARKPLDLPSGGRGEDTEESPPDTIVFYGGEYEGDGFFWCLDRSGSMAEDGRLAQLKIEVTEALDSLSSSSEFSLVSFASDHTAWSPTPREANTSMVLSAKAWVTSLTAFGETCLGPAAVETIGIANQCNRDAKQIFILSDGVPYCDGTNTSAACIASSRAANWQRIPVNTIYISEDVAGVAFMQAMAAYGGSFRHAVSD